ncbi:glycoside hydrolase domain-containing protein [Lentibacillus salinarum]|uniref:Glycoside hydrolase domain-containing protein n=1 Tax=Lentibacillus salinarum TaxID=446820 RepID=A0ABW3ZTR9_9BACI
MHRSQIYYLIGLGLLIAAPLILAFLLSSSSDQSDSPSDGDQNDQNGDSGQDIYWGVDSASYTDDNQYQCVTDNFGEPEVWGRYLGDKGDVSEGLDQDEVNFLHENDTRILVIYNHFSDATGYDHGAEEAEQAIAYAEDLDIPDGVALFGDIEPGFPVDSAFMQGWYDTLSESAYETALYGAFDEDSELLEAYNAMDQDAQENTVVWTAFPQKEITAKDNAPDYNPQGPENARVYGWQYAIESETCNIDTSLFQDEMLDYLWNP